jgi:hypothetical protein
MVSLIAVSVRDDSEEVLRWMRSLEGRSENSFASALSRDSLIYL